MEPVLHMSLAWDHFVAGVRADYVQERLLLEGPKTLDEARETAKRLEAAQTARRQMGPN